MFDHFDTFFSVIENASQLQISNLVRAIEILHDTTDNLGQLLDSYLKQDALDRQTDHQNVCKMVIYLLVTTVKQVDDFVKKNSGQSSAAGRKNRKNTDDSLSHFINYDNKRYDVLRQVFNFMQLPIEKLWEMSIVEEPFVK